MATTDSTPEADYDAHPIRERFAYHFPTAFGNGAVHSSAKYQIDLDGHAWTEASHILVLLADDCTHYGNIDLTGYEPAEYLGTTREGYSREVYEFDTGTAVSAVRADLVRRLANDVLEMSYEKVRGLALADPDANLTGIPKGTSPILFDIPDAPFRVAVAPLLKKGDI